MILSFRTDRSGQTEYRNDHKFLDGQVRANSVDPDQTAPSLIRVYTVCHIPSASFGCPTLW